MRKNLKKSLLVSIPTSILNHVVHRFLWSFSRRSPLWQRGVKGDFIITKDNIILKIPLPPPFPKGELKNILGKVPFKPQDF